MDGSRPAATGAVQPSASELLATMFTMPNGMPSLDGQKEFKMHSFDAELRRQPGVALGMDCVHVSSSKVCGLLIKSINEAGVVAAWNAQSTEPAKFQPGDFIVKVNGVDSNESGVKALADALRTAGDRIRLTVWGVRGSEPVQREPEPISPEMNERIQWLSERSRICTRGEWESHWLPTLPRNSQRAGRSVAGSCSVCMENIAMDQKVRGLSCGHYFHLDCLAEWFMRDRSLEISCPLCRTPMSEQPSRWVSL